MSARKKYLNFIRKRGSLKLASVLVGSSLVLLTGPASGAGQHQWGAAYIDWTGVELSRASSISQEITILGAANKSYWSVNWGWDGRTDGAYAGVQTGGQRADGSDGGLGIFSIWDAREAVPGPKSWCLPFGGEGVGMSCRTNLNIEVSGLYKVSVFPDSSRGDEWWGAEVVTPNKESIILGYIKSPAKNLRTTRLGNFIEYFGTQLPCDSVGLASARFGLPNSATGANGLSAKFSRPQQGCVNSWMELGQNWSTLGPSLRFGGSVKAPADAPILATFTKATTTPPAPKPVKYKNCTELNKVYPGGVAKSASSSNKGGKIRFVQVVNAKVYDLNKSLDRDKDGLACER